MGLVNPCRLLLLSLCAAFAVQAAHAQMRVIQASPQASNPLQGPVIINPLATSDPRGTATMWWPDRDPGGDTKYRPEIGQEGKDVIWVPTPDSLIKAMLTVAKVGKQDYVVDLGSGDGRIAIAAARDFGARAHGIEYNPDMVMLALRNAVKEGVGNRVTFETADIFQTDFSQATVVTLYLLPSLNLKLRDRLLKMRPGTRIASHAFNMGDWQPDETIATDDATGFFWVVPADASGRWAFEIGNARFVATLGQRYQMLAAAGNTPIRDGRLRGRAISLTLANGAVVEGEIQGNAMMGSGWTATRIRTTP